MPRKDGTGPPVKGGAGGLGRGAGSGGGPGTGAGGNCFCPGCGQRVPHTRGIPCNTRKCDKCGRLMVRE